MGFLRSHVGKDGNNALAAEGKNGNNLVVITGINIHGSLCLGCQSGNLA